MGWWSVAAPRSPAGDRSEPGPELFSSILGLVGARKLFVGGFVTIRGATGSSRLGILKGSTPGVQVGHAARPQPWSSPPPRLTHEQEVTP